MTAPAPDCIFCKIVAGQIPSTKVLENDRVLAFLDINPLNDGHLLIIPKTHAASVYDISPEDLSAVTAAARNLALALKKSLDPAGLNLIQSNGRVAGQIIDHFHLHLIPRWPGDALVNALDWSLRPGDPGRIAEVAGKIKGAVV